MIKTYGLVALFGALGGMARYMLGLLIGTETFPLAALLVNLLGCFFLAFFYSFINVKFSLSNEMKLALSSGLIGSFAAFSAFSVNSVILLQNGEYLLGSIYILSSLLGGFAFTRFGYYFGNRILTRGEVNKKVDMDYVE